jgi:hypothetical protein
MTDRTMQECDSEFKALEKQHYDMRRAAIEKLKQIILAEAYEIGAFTAEEEISIDHRVAREKIAERIAESMIMQEECKTWNKVMRK